MAKVARMYHERGLRQSEIAAELHISQPRVSRLLKRAVELGVVRITISVPSGVHTDLEDALEARFGLAEAVVTDTGSSDADDEGSVERALGAAAAVYLETTLIGGDSIGISSWSSTLLAAVEAMRPSTGQVVEEVVQLVGGVGDPRVQVEATRLLSSFASATGATPVFLPAPGLLGSSQARESLMGDPSVTQVTAHWAALTTALVGIGTLDPSPLLRSSGNGISDADQDQLRTLGAVGDVCLRFFDAEGVPVASGLDERVIGVSAADLRRIPRRIAVAGGVRKVSAIRGALRGGWANVLVTDVTAAQVLLGG
ncbi:DNA-binding transcriptional regulator [Cellulomonas soli]|uniref:DNA-binding transcriptional regulator n=2 Tax=Cellulomonas soli TaxID=931535 RepID=A0A512P8C4_9CELL|nr:DNA-binding transcriptional regulator [Cellulomonas soli]